MFLFAVLLVAAMSECPYCPKLRAVNPKYAGSPNQYLLPAFLLDRKHNQPAPVVPQRVHPGRKPKGDLKRVEKKVPNVAPSVPLTVKAQIAAIQKTDTVDSSTWKTLGGPQTLVAAEKLEKDNPRKWELVKSAIILASAVAKRMDHPQHFIRSSGLDKFLTQNVDWVKQNVMVEHANTWDVKAYLKSENHVLELAPFWKLDLFVPKGKLEEVHLIVLLHKALRKVLKGKVVPVKLTVDRRRVVATTVDAVLKLKPAAQLTKATVTSFESTEAWIDAFMADLGNQSAFKLGPDRVMRVAELNGNDQVFEAVGRMLALSFLQGRPLKKIKFQRAFYSFLLDEPVSFKLLESEDVEKFALFTQFLSAKNDEDFEQLLLKLPKLPTPPETVVNKPKSKEKVVGWMTQEYLVTKNKKAFTLMRKGFKDVLLIELKGRINSDDLYLYSQL